MKFTAHSNSANFDHRTPATIGVLITNVGTPAAPTTRAVRKYLREFLWDARMVETPRWLWWLILQLVILRARPRKSAAAYEKIWRKDGAPLRVISQLQQQKLQRQLRQELNSAGHDFPDNITVALGMRYGQPSIADALQELRAAGVRNLVVLPLFPQYSAATTASTMDAVFAELSRWRWLPALRFINHYHDDKNYINALANSVRAHRKTNGDAELLLISFHGMPQAYFRGGDPYHCECQKTARLLAAELGLADDAWRLSFQSRVGREPWLQPYTDQTLRELPKSGVRRVQVICPGFAADCLETLEEIAIAGREIFMRAGGERYEYIPCLNDGDAHIQTLSHLVHAQLGDWLVPSTDNHRTEQQKRARAMGAKN